MSRKLAITLLNVGVWGISIVFVQMASAQDVPPAPSTFPSDSEEEARVFPDEPTPTDEPAPTDEPSPAASPDAAVVESTPESTDPLEAMIGIVENVIGQLNLQFHGFASQGFLVSVHNNYLARSTHGSFEMTEVALNLTSQPLDDLRIGIQLFSRELGDIGNYTIRLDWFYVDYRFADWFGVRLGRTKIPFGLYNEINDVDVARVPVLLPQSTYPIENRDFQLAQTGGEIYGRIPLDVAGTLAYRIYAGTLFIDTPAFRPENPLSISAVHVPYIVGSRMMWETPLTGLRMGGSAQVLELQTDLVNPMGMTFDLDIFAVLLVASVEYTDGVLLLAAEYGRWYLDYNSQIPVLNATAWNERAYVMMSYRITDWFTPGLYYSLLYATVDDRESRERQQHDLALTLRFDINEYLLVKLEGHYMHGTAALNSALNGGTPNSELLENWAVFFVKTTGYF